MTDYGVLANLLVIFTVSIAVVFVFHQFRLPSIAGFLVAGALIGPHGLNLISDIGTVQVLAEIGIVLLLFTIGIEFSLVQLASMRRLMFLAAPIQVGGVLLIAWLGAMLVGLSWRQGMFNPWGPMSAPATKNPAIEGSRNWWNTKTTAIDTVKITSRFASTP